MRGRAVARAGRCTVLWASTDSLPNPAAIGASTDDARLSCENHRRRHEEVQDADQRVYPLNPKDKNTMEIPSQLTPALWGAVAGAAAVALIGFTSGGWVTAGTAETLATQRATKSVVAALAPICVENFKRSNDAPTKLAELKKVSSWEQGAFITKGGWAAMPGAATVDNAIATSCAEMIVASKT